VPGPDGAVDVDGLEALVGSHDRSDTLFEPDMGVASSLSDRASSWNKS